jgi:hypothetical protein
MSDSAWPFDQPRDCAVVTLRSIVFGGQPILRVTHDAEDHGWQFLNGRRVNTADAAVVAFEEIVALDKSLLQLADLPPGWCATRSSFSSPWERARIA